MATCFPLSGPGPGEAQAPATERETTSLPGRERLKARSSSTERPSARAAHLRARAFPMAMTAWLAKLVGDTENHHGAVIGLPKINPSATSSKDIRPYSPDFDRGRSYRSTSSR